MRQLLGDKLPSKQYYYWNTSYFDTDREDRPRMPHLRRYDAGAIKPLVLRIRMNAYTVAFEDDSELINHA